MKYLQVLLFLFTFDLSHSQSIQVSRLKGKNKTLNISAGDRIHIIYRDTLTNIGAGQASLNVEKLMFVGKISDIDSAHIILGNRRKHLEIDIRQIVKVRKVHVGLYTTQLLTLSTGSLIYLNSKDALYLGPTSLTLLAVTLTNRILWDKVVNPLKNTSPNTCKRKNCWQLQYIGN